MVQKEMDLANLACITIPQLIGQYEEGANYVGDIVSGIAEYQEALQPNNTRKNHLLIWPVNPMNIKNIAFFYFFYIFFFIVWRTIAPDV